MRDYFATHPNSLILSRFNPRQFDERVRIDIQQTTTTTGPVAAEYQVPIGRIAAEYQKSAAVAQGQLANDAASIDGYNAEVGTANGRVEGILSDVAGLDLGDDREGWRKWGQGLQGFAYNAASDDPKPTFFENVPLAYQPQAMPDGRGGCRRRADDSRPAPSRVSSAPAPGPKYDCFGAGTLVRTVSGSRGRSRPCSSASLVLGQDIKTGKLGYRTITVVHHNPPSTRSAGSTSTASRSWVEPLPPVLGRGPRLGDGARPQGRRPDPHPGRRGQGHGDRGGQGPALSTTSTWRTTPTSSPGRWPLWSMTTRCRTCGWAPFDAGGVRRG